tara:strand:+ start:1326 stop:1661 length:336 start_codon:yes stop_codon:yes gene_type:complete
MRYCFDLDGTLCTQRTLDYENAEPFKERILMVNRLYDEGHYIMIDTARGSGATKGKDWYDITKNQIDSWELKYHELRTGVKFFADIYIDDKAKLANTFFEVCNESTIGFNQ